MWGAGNTVCTPWTCSLASWGFQSCGAFGQVSVMTRKQIHPDMSRLELFLRKPCLRTDLHDVSWAEKGGSTPVPRRAQNGTGLIPCLSFLTCMHKKPCDSYTHGVIVCVCVYMVQLFFSCSVVSTLCDPMNCITPGFPVLHHLLEFAQTHVQWFHPTISSSVVPFSFCLQFFPSGSFPVSRLFASMDFPGGSVVKTVFLPGKSYGQGSLGYSPWGCKESDMA